MKKISFIMHRFVGGGAEKVTILLANELQKQGMNITFFVKENAGELCNTIDKNIRIIELGTNPYIFLLKLYYYFSKFHFDCTFGVSMGMSTYAIIVNKYLLKKEKLVPIIHNAMSKTDEPKLNIKCKLFNKYQDLINKVVIVSDTARIDFINITGIDENKCITIYNPVVSNTLFTKSNERNNHKWFVHHDAPVIISAGRLCEQKNYKLLLDSVFETLKTVDVRCIILGKGELKSELEEYAKKLGILSNVDFYGFANNPYSFFKNADCFVMSSHYEGLPTVLIEAMACGCPVVSTDCISGPREILEDGKYGLLVQPNNAKKMSEAIIDTLRTGKNFSVLIEKAKEFNVQNAVEKYVQVIEE